jgi:hypothetical protein
MAQVASMAVANMALVGNMDPARIRHHPARRNTPNIPNIHSDLRRNRSLVTDPVSDQDMDSRDTGRIMGQALVDNPLAGASQDKRRLGGQTRRLTNRHAAHAIKQAPYRTRVSDFILPMRRVTIHQCAQMQRDARTGIAIWVWMRNVMYPKESLNV